ncbi:MAG: hypothetical protein ACI4TE_09160 [Alphaproteobacteria bacterium]
MVKTYISSNILDYQCNGFPFICRAKELKEMAKTGDYQAIILDRLEIDFSFNDIIGITEYDVDVVPVSGGIKKRHKAEQHYFSSYKEARRFIEQLLISHLTENE